MKIVLVTGFCPPGTCGVGDYARRLAGALEKRGIEVGLMSSGRWSLFDVGKDSESVRALMSDIIHLQYPTSGFGYRLGPQLYAMKRRCVTTLHEVSQSHVLRKLSLYAFTIRAQHLIFTSEFERQFAVRWAPWIGEISSVIPVGSNIDSYVSNGAPISCREVVYFGLFMPRKGLEDVLNLAALIKERGLDLVVRLVGSYRPEHAAYVRELRRKSAGLPVCWDEALTDSQVSERLAGSCIAYLPFPDGVSERRASVKAALVNRMAVVTTRGSATPGDLEKVMRFAASPREALDVILNLVRSETERSKLNLQIENYVERFTWGTIAESHLRIYQDLASNHADRG